MKELQVSVEEAKTQENQIIDALFNEVTNMISIDGIRNFVIDAYKEMPLLKQHHAVFAAKNLIKRLESLRLLNPMMPNKQCDFAIAACLIHNYSLDSWPTFTKNKDISEFKKVMNVFQTRFDLYEKALQHEDDIATMAAFDYIFEIVEAQFGENTPIDRCRPVQGQPSAILAEVLWWYYNEPDYFHAENAKAE